MKEERDEEKGGSGKKKSKPNRGTLSLPSSRRRAQPVLAVDPTAKPEFHRVALVAPSPSRRRSFPQPIKPDADRSSPKPSRQPWKSRLKLLPIDVVVGPSSPPPPFTRTRTKSGVDAKPVSIASPPKRRSLGPLPSLP
jgi:hypothetical protein